MKKLINSVIVASIFVVASSFGDIGKTVKPGDINFGRLTQALGVDSNSVSKLKIYNKTGDTAVVAAIRKNNTGVKGKMFKPNVLKAKLINLKTMQVVSKGKK